MHKITTQFRPVLTALAVALVVGGQSQRALAGWTGVMDGTGKGWASVNVSSRSRVSRTINTLGSFPANTLNPSAAMAPISGYLTNAPLPSGSSSGTVARVKGSAGYVWTATTIGSGGDSTDNEDITSRATINPSPCAFVTMTSESDESANGTGTITVSATATAGTGLLLRGIEYPVNAPLPESVSDLLLYGEVKFDILMVGPFELTKDNCKALVIPYVTPAEDRQFYFVTDGYANSTPITLTCPPDVAFGCADEVTYPVPEVTGGCGNIALSYDPPAEALPVGVVTTVTVSAVDETGGVATCTFQADNTAKGIPLVVTCPPAVTFGCSDPVTYPQTSVSGACGSYTVSYNPPANALPIGTNIVTVTAEDSTGNIAECSFVAVRKSFTFGGFEEPLRCSNGGSCDSPARTLNAGCILPIEFKTKCGNTPYTAGTPTFVITKCPSQPVLSGNFRLDGSEWEYKWNTKNAGKGTFKIDVTLQDGSHQIVYVKLK